MERIDHIREVISEDSSDRFLHYALGLELAKKQNYQEAIAAFQQVLQLDESYIAAYYQIAIIFIHIDIVDVARTYIKKGIHQAEIKRDMKAQGELAELLEGIE